ncbi:MAG: DUF1822 family protein [Richelia sp. RM1_1_1]|nr:DUF1822 family protein [Richelia sp. RM1_1_1]
MTYTFADPKEWLFQIIPDIQSQLWEESQVYPNPSSCWCAYLNKVALRGFTEWIKSEYDMQATVWESSPNVVAFWQFVNGTAILLNERRIVLIPSEAIEDSELEVPQEWVDIPSWTADFYLAVQIQPDEGWVRFWGYTTHQELKALASYDSEDRIYSMDARHLTLDLHAFWTAYQYCQIEDIQASIPNLPELSTTQAENILQSLSSSTVFPRLKLQWSDWGALLDNEQYRLRLHQQQQQDSSLLDSSLVNLSAWFQDIYEDSWQAIETFFNSEHRTLAFNFRNSAGLSDTNIKRAKVINLGTEIEPQKVVLLVGLISSANQKVAMRVQLHPFDDKYLPSNINLALVSESAEIIQEVQSRIQDNSIQLKLFEGEIGEYFSIRVSNHENQITENFMI